MDMGILLVGIILCAILFVPFFFIIRIPKKRMKKKKEAFQQVLNQKNITLKDFEIINDLIIGLSQDEQKLITTSTDQMQMDLEILQISKEDSFSVRTSSTDAHDEWVGLEINSKAGQRMILFMDDSGEELPKRNFYTCQQDAQKWVDLLNKIKNQ